MSDFGRGSAQGSVSRYGMLPPGTGRTERLRLVGLGIACALPLPLVLVLLILYAAVGTLSPADRIVGIVVGLSAVAVIVVQVLTPIAARSSIVDDQVHKSGIARTRLIMTLFSVPVMVVAVLLALAELAMGVGVGISGALLILVIGFLGILPRYRLRRIERLAATRPPP